MKPLWVAMILALMTGCQSAPPAPVADHHIGYGNASKGESSTHEPRPALNHPQAVGDALNGYFSSWQGVRHRFGGASRRGVDCSAFVQLTFRDVFGVRIPRTTRMQSKLGKRVSRRSLAPGDLVFFKTGWRGRHVGVYVGSGNFIHASESKGVTKSSLQDQYWRKRYWKARRVL